MSRTRNPNKNDDDSSKFMIPDYHNKIDNLTSLKDWMNFIRETRGSHPQDNPAMQELFKKVIIKDWIKARKPSSKNKPKNMFAQALKLLDEKDLNFIEFSRFNDDFYYEKGSLSSDYMFGEQYRCEKCGQIYYKKFKAADATAQFDLELYEDMDIELSEGASASETPFHEDSDDDETWEKITDFVQSLEQDEKTFEMNIDDEIKAGTSSQF